MTDLLLMIFVYWAAVTFFASSKLIDAMFVKPRISEEQLLQPRIGPSKAFTNFIERSNKLEYTMTMAPSADEIGSLAASYHDCFSPEDLQFWIDNPKQREKERQRLSQHRGYDYNDNELLIIINVAIAMGRMYSTVPHGMHEMAIKHFAKTYANPPRSYGTIE